MIHNYLLSTLRNLRKHLSYALINVFGLGLGLVIALLLAVWIKHELSYDQFHKHASSLYRVSLEINFGGEGAKHSVSPTALLPALEHNFKEIETGVRLYNPSNPYIVKKDDQLYQEDHFYFADSTFFQVFSYQLIQGNPANALTEPKSVVISESTAKKYFGEEDPLGKDLLINGQANYVVTGVIEDAPDNSYLQYDLIGSFSSLRQATEENRWWSANYQTFVVVQPSADLNALTDKTNELVKKELASELTNPGDYVKYNWTKMTDIHLRSEAQTEMEPVGNIQYVYMFAAIALLVLIIACINYINLATARASFRAKEVGVRKVVGAHKSQLIFQFISESVVITVLAFLIAFAAAQFLLPLFNTLTGKSLSYLSFFEPSFLIDSVLILLVIAVGAGAYPALAITAFKPVNILKGNFNSSSKGVWLRKSLVVFQFCISIILIIGTVAIVKQLHFIQSTKLGYDRENTIVIPLDRKTEDVYTSLKTEFERSGHVAHLGRATESPVEIKGGYSLSVPGAAEHGLSVTAISADDEFIPALGMDIVAGRNLNEGDLLRFRADTLFSFILNESTIKDLYLTNEEAIGKKVSLNGRNGEIIGVVKDFHFSSLHRAIGPLVIFNGEHEFNFMFAKLNPGNITQTLADLKTISNRIVPHRPFTYEFLDAQYASLYSSEQRMGTLFGIFATLAIIIACLGLLGLVSFSATQKTKEIGIRKVLGANVSAIILLITKEYTALIAISMVLGIPLSIYAVDLLLSSFVYRTSLGVVPVLLAVAGCILLAFATASYQAVKAAFINPTDTLRNE